MGTLTKPSLQPSDSPLYARHFIDYLNLAAPKLCRLTLHVRDPWFQEQQWQLRPASRRRRVRLRRGRHGTTDGGNDIDAAAGERQRRSPATCGHEALFLSHPHAPVVDDGAGLGTFSSDVGHIILALECEDFHDRVHCA
ncbi:unnamed protein product [Symbiodinium sp. CCMP2592]|nr:unnamed protein product [Symbiodinium sp. CCMP2592]